MSPNSIQKAPTSRPIPVIGTLSPYPTVVTVTTANHSPSMTPSA